MDTVVSEPARLSRRARTLVAVVLLLLLAGAAAERWQAGRELDALLAAVAANEQVVTDSRRSLAGLAEYQSQLLSGADVPRAARAAAYENQARDAERWLGRLQEPQRRLADVRPLPWHGDLRAAREAYDRRVAAWESVLQRTALDPVAAGPVSLTATRDAARTALELVGGSAARDLVR